MRFLPNSRSLANVQSPTSGHTPESLKAVGQARIYIQSLQVDLSVTPTHGSNEGIPGQSIQNDQVNNVRLQLNLFRTAHCPVLSL